MPAVSGEMTTGEYRFGIPDEPDTVFLEISGRIVLKALFGMACGVCGNDDGHMFSRGLALIRTSIGRFEADSLKLARCAFGPGNVKLDFEAASGRLKLSSRWSFCTETGMWSRKDSLTNTGSDDVTLYGCLARFSFSPGRYSVYSQGSHWCNENQGSWQVLDHGSVVLGCEGGRLTMGGTPYAAVREEGSGLGAAFHVLPRGNWIIRFRCITRLDSLPICALECGLSDEDLHMKLRPGDAVELPEILFHCLPGGEVHLGAHKLHRYVNNHIVLSSRQYAPVVYNTWFYEFSNLNTVKLREQLKAAREIGCEIFVVDAGWFGRGQGWWSQVGDWREKEDMAFLGRMSDFADEVRQEGLGFGLWVEPERIGPETPVARDHPEWFCDAGNGFLRPALEQKPVYDYMLGMLAGLIRKYRLAWMKLDFNLDLGADASGSNFYYYYEAWYPMLDSLRERYPECFIEGCAGGGLRSDLNTLSHCDGHFMSDTINPVDAVRISEGAMLRLPPGRLTKWVGLRNATHVVAGQEGEGGLREAKLVTPSDAGWGSPVVCSAEFTLRAAMPGMPGITGEVAGLPDRTKRTLQEHIAFYKKWRTFITRSEARLLTPVTSKEKRDGWSAVQLQANGSRESLVFAFRFDDRCPIRRFFMKNLEPDEQYAVTDMDHQDKVSVYTGMELMKDGIEIDIPTANGAKIFILGPE